MSLKICQKWCHSQEDGWREVIVSVKGQCLVLLRSPLCTEYITLQSLPDSYNKWFCSLSHTSMYPQGGLPVPAAVNQNGTWWDHMGQEWATTSERARTVTKVATGYHHCLTCLCVWRPQGWPKVLRFTPKQTTLNYKWLKEGIKKPEIFKQCWKTRCFLIRYLNF